MSDRTTFEVEVIRMKRVMRAVEDLNPAQQKRILSYLLDSVSSQLDLFKPAPVRMLDAPDETDAGLSAE